MMDLVRRRSLLLIFYNAILPLAASVFVIQDSSSWNTVLHRFGCISSQSKLKIKDDGVIVHNVNVNANSIMHRSSSRPGRNQKICLQMSQKQQQLDSTHPTNGTSRTTFAPIGSSSSSSKNNVTCSCTVARLAVRSYNKDGSNKPASKNYTTRKDERDRFTVTAAGAKDDYNHYRTAALNSTTDRALSLVTSNIYHDLRHIHGYPDIEIGDLGENLLVDGWNHTDFTVGSRYKIGSQVVVEITERVEPCGNLCQLPFINDDKLASPLIVKKCVSFLAVLDKEDGYRGWYAKVLEEGSIEQGDTVAAMAPT